MQLGGTCIKNELAKIAHMVTILFSKTFCLIFSLFHVFVKKLYEICMTNNAEPYASIVFLGVFWALAPSVPRKAVDSVLIQGGGLNLMYMYYHVH